MKKLLLGIILLAAQTGKAQLLDSLSLDTVRAWHSIQAADKQPTAVIKLVLDKKKLVSFPEAIKNYPNLQYLDLSKNRLKTIPAWIGELTSLQTLILSRNDIDSLPPEIGNLTHLKYLIMNRTDLVALPPEIGQLRELRYMDLWDDNIGSFPSELGNLANTLKWLDLRDILISDEEQQLLKSYLPHTHIFFSPDCQCEQE